MADRLPRIVITGAAHGVGRLCALSLAQWPVELILCDLDGLGLQEISRSTGALGRFCDVASEASVAILAAELLDRFDAIDGLINVAGSSYVRPLGTWRVSRALLPALRQSHGEAILVNVAARQEVSPDICVFPYASSGEAVEGLNEALLNAARGTNVRVAAVAGEARPPRARATHLSLCASQTIALVAQTFGLPPFTVASRRPSAA